MDSLINRYDALIENQTSIKQHYHEIIEFKKSQAKINLLLSLPQTAENQAQKQQLESMKENIEQALKEALTILRQQEKKINAYPMSIELLVASDVGKLAKCFIEQQRKWRNSIVLEVDIEQQTAKVKRYGKDDQQPLQLPAYYLKVLKQPDTQLFKQGTLCKAIYSGDGQFYPCIIQKISEEGYHVKYKKYNTEEVVVLHRLRPITNQNQKKQEVEFDNLNELKIPEKYKILPNDPENVKKNKKNKVKALKFAFKNAQLQQVNKEKQTKWKDWNINASKSTGYFKTKRDLDVIYPKDPK